MNILFIGAGYVGLVSGACLARLGHRVRVLDVDSGKVRAINRKKAPIYEKGLPELLRKVVPSKLSAHLACELPEILSREPVEAVFIAVGTPSRQDGSIDASFVQAAAKNVGQALRRSQHPFVTVVVKSTVVPGTTDGLAAIIERESGLTRGKGFGLAMNPEFLKEGVALDDFLRPDRIVIGADDAKSRAAVHRVYAKFPKRLRMDSAIRTAEMVKYASNAFLAAKISFANEIGNACKRLGIDVAEVAKGMGRDSRISPHFLNAGIGFGGSCFPKDVAALRALYKELGLPSRMMDATLATNEEQPLRLVDLAQTRLGTLSGKTIAVLGLAFKPGTDDVREARSKPIVSALIKRGARVRAFDPQGQGNFAREFGKNKSVYYAKSAADAVKSAEAALIVTEWPEFKQPALYKGLAVFDGRHVFKAKPKGAESYAGIAW